MGMTISNKHKANETKSKLTKEQVSVEQIIELVPELKSMASLNKVFDALAVKAKRIARLEAESYRRKMEFAQNMASMFSDAELGGNTKQLKEGLSKSLEMEEGDDADDLIRSIEKKRSQDVRETINRSKETKSRPSKSTPEPKKREVDQDQDLMDVDEALASGPHPVFLKELEGESYSAPVITDADKKVAKELSNKGYVDWSMIQAPCFDGKKMEDFLSANLMDEFGPGSVFDINMAKKFFLLRLNISLKDSLYETDKNTNLFASTVRTCVARLAKKGLILRLSRGVYKVPDDFSNTVLGKYKEEFIGGI